MSSAAAAVQFIESLFIRLSNPDPKDIEKALNYFMKFIDDVTVNNRALAYFRSLMFTEIIMGSHNISERLGKMGLINAITILLETSRDNAPLCLQNFAVLGTFDGNIPLIASSGALESEVSCVERNYTDPNVAECAFISLQGILPNSEDARERFLKCGGIEVTITAMNLNLESENVQALGSRVLANCSIEMPLVRKRILCCGGIEAIIQGMMRFKESEIVQISGCNSLGTVAIRNTMYPLISKGGVDAIIQALKMHPTNSEVQKNAVYALGNITSNNKKYVQRIISKGSVDAIIESMKRNESDHDVITTACYSLSWIFSRQDIYEENFTEEVREVAEAAIKRYPSDKSMRQRVDSLLRIEDPRATLAREENVCSGVYVKRCGKPNCGTLKKYYCEDCCAPQWAYECLTCGKGEGQLTKYCVACWKKYHKGHDGVKVFITTICGRSLESPDSE